MAAALEKFKDDDLQINNVCFCKHIRSSKAATKSSGPVLGVPRADEARTGAKEWLFGICVHRGGV